MVIILLRYGKLCRDKIIEYNHIIIFETHLTLEHSLHTTVTMRRNISKVVVIVNFLVIL